MAHNRYIAPMGVWVTGMVPTPGRMRELDDVLTRSINGDQGGTWSPRTPIYLTGSPLTLSGSQSTIGGGVTTGRYGAVVMAAGQFPTFLVPRLRTIVVPFMGVQSAYGSSHALQQFDYDTPSLSVRTRALGAILQMQIPPDLLHDGATITSIVFRYAIGHSHPIINLVGGGTTGGVPANRPTLRVFRMAGDATETQVNLLSTGSVTIPGATPAAYYANGVVQSVTFTPDQNNVIALGSYRYFVEWTDESGANVVDPIANNVLHSFTMTMAGITQQRPT